MKRRLWMGLLVIAGLICVGCDANRSDVEGDSDISAYDGFVVTYPESFDGEFNPDGLEVGPEVGQLAPEITGVDLKGNAFKLSDYRGKVVMLNFYGDW